jgi:hypothetical protein
MDHLPKSRRISRHNQTNLLSNVDVHCVNELKGRSSVDLFAIDFSGYMISGSDPAAASD